MESNSTKNAEASQWTQKAWTHLSQVRQQSPLIQCITNFVSMDLTANTLLAAGASPAMLHSIHEIPEFTPQARALYVNIGTLTADWLPAMKTASALAMNSGKPWVLDPVAVGASGFRLKACLELVQHKPTVIRGNGSEIIALSEASVDISTTKVKKKKKGVLLLLFYFHFWLNLYMLFFSLISFGY